MTFDLG